MLGHALGITLNPARALRDYRQTAELVSNLDLVVHRIMGGTAGTTFLQAVQVLSVPAIAVAAVMISLQQYRIARQKLKLDLYPRRYAIYVAFHDGVVAALNKQFETTFDDATRDMGARLREARFLFGSDTFDFLNQLETDVLTYRHGAKTIDGRNLQGWNDTDHASYLKDHHDTARRLLAALTALPAKINRYLSIDDDLSFSLAGGFEVKQLTERATP